MSVLECAFAETPYKSFSTAKQFALPDGHKCIKAAMGGSELVVAISDSGDVFTFGTDLGRRYSHPRLGRPTEDEQGEVAPPTTPTMLSRGKERGHREGRALCVSAVKDFFLIGWETASAVPGAPVQADAAAGPTTPVRPAAAKSASPPADAPQTSGSTRVRTTSLASAAAVGALVVATASISASYYIRQLR